MSAKYKGTRPWAVGPPASRLLGGGGHISHAASPCIQQGRPPVPHRARSTVQPSQEPVPEVSLSPESAPSHGEGESHTGSAPQARRAEVTVPTPGSAPSPVQNSRPRQATHSSRPPTALSTARPQDHAAPMAPARSPLAQEEGGAWSLRGRRASPGLGHTQTRASFMGVRPDRRGQRPAQRPGTLCQAPPLPGPPRAPTVGTRGPRPRGSTHGGRCGNARVFPTGSPTFRLTVCSSFSAP